MLALNLKLPTVNIYGDAKVLLDGLFGKGALHPNGMNGWIIRIKHLMSRLNDPPMSHIYRECNTKVDHLSRKGLLDPIGFFHIEHYAG